jgi:hypothetical protein
MEISMQETQQEVQQDPALEKAQLQLSDLMLAVQAIQLASQRGAFKAEEFTTIGGVFDRITAFLQNSGVSNASSAPTSDETVTTPVTE